jgi:hypothetical protein
MIAIRQKNDEIPPEWQTAEGYLREAFLEYTRVEAESHGLDPEDEADPLNEISILAAIGFRILNLS